jgi:RNA polymerase sigma factor (sigma-70 family)
VTAPVRQDALLPVAAARGGDRRAQRLIFDAFEVPMMSYCTIATRGDRDAARDLVQEVFVRAFRSLDRLEDPTKLRSWVFAIAANVVRTRLAGDARRAEVLALYALDQDVGGGDTLEREARIARVRALIEGVEDPVLRRMVELKYGEPEHTTRAIAEVLAVPHGTVTVKLMRFRARIKTKLALLLAAEGLEP